MTPSKETLKTLVETLPIEQILGELSEICHDKAQTFYGDRDNPQWDLYDSVSIALQNTLRLIFRKA